MRFTCSLFLLEVIDVCWAFMNGERRMEKKMKILAFAAVALMFAVCFIGFVAISDDAVDADGGTTNVAKIGNTKYSTLAEAVAYVHTLDGANRMAGTEIVLLRDAEGSGVPIGYKELKGGTTSGNSPVKLTIDLNGFTYTVIKSTVGSSGTETNGFQMLKDSYVTIKNGTLTSKTDKILLQNYCNLTLDNVIITSNTNSYILSNNFGNVTITGDTHINASSDKTAFDLWYGMNDEGLYDSGVFVTFDENFTGTVNGTIEYGAASRITDKDLTNKAVLTINGSGTFKGDIKFSSAVTVADIRISSGSFTDLKSAVEYATPGATITLADNENGKYTLTDDVTITLKSDVTLNGVKFVGKHALTITSKDGGHFTLNVTYDFGTKIENNAGNIFEVSSFVLNGADLNVIQKDTGKTVGPKSNQAGCSVFGTGSVEVKDNSTMTITTNEYANRVFYNNGSSLSINGPNAKVILEKATSSTVSLSMTNGATLEIKNPLKTAGNFYPNINNTGSKCNITVTGAANGNHGLFFYGTNSNAKDADAGVLNNCNVVTDGIVGFYSNRSVDATGSTFEAKELVVAKSSVADMANVKGATFKVTEIGALNPNDEYKPINDKELYLDGVTFNDNTVIDYGVTLNVAGTVNGTITLEKAAKLIISKDSTFTGTINGPDNNKLVANGMKAGEGGITITGGSLIINGKIMDAGGSEAGVTVTVLGGAIKINGSLGSGATMVIEKGTTVTIEDEMTFSSECTVNNNGIIDNKGTITNNGVLTNNGTIKMTGASEIKTDVENNKVVNNGVVVDERAKTADAVPITNDGTVVAKNNADQYKEAKVDVIVQDPETAKTTDGTVIVDENKFIFIDAITTTGKLNIVLKDGDYKQYTVTIPEGTSIAAGTVISVSFIEYQSDSVTRYQISTPGIENFSMKLPCQIGFKKAKVYCDDSELGVSKVRYDAGTGYVTFDAAHNSVFTIVLSNASPAGTTTLSGGDTANDYSLVIAFVVLVASLGFLAYVIKRR